MKKMWEKVFWMPCSVMTALRFLKRNWKISHMRNVLLADDERAAYGVIEKENILKEDYLPILENNYIFSQIHKNIQWQEKDKEFWVVYKVDINKDILDMVSIS